ncbi:DUF1049 domain-containing protein [Luethyella okanaganae]|uniref:DUF1049 domain-containing protein n=1 Tax=Luethyella okanaganae TaxID=69372 RepID=A0ABW1VIT2_9MICO
MSEDGHEDTARPWYGRGPKQWIGIGLVLLSVLFIAQNRDQASIDLAWIDVRTPLWLALAVVGLVGFAAGWLVSGRRAKRRARG